MLRQEDKMNCEKYEALFTGWIEKDLTTAESKDLEQHISGCAGCKQELEAMQVLWQDMGEIEAPDPSPHLRVKFQAMLNTYKAEVEHRNVWDNFKESIGQLWHWRPQLAFPYQAAILLVCFAGGYLLFHTANSDQNEKLQTLSTQVHDLKQTMMLALLENPSASERMRAVNYTSEIKHADKEIIDALLTTLNNDDNVNVRLSTLDVLSHMANHPEVREGLIKSIEQQDSPLMQSAIADVMIKLQEKRSVKPFRELLKQKDLNPYIKDKIKETITELI
jgi:hypothetical protein